MLKKYVKFPIQNLLTTMAMSVLFEVLTTMKIDLHLQKWLEVKSGWLYTLFLGRFGECIVEFSSTFVVVKDITGIDVVCFDAHEEFQQKPKNKTFWIIEYLMLLLWGLKGWKDGTSTFWEAKVFLLNYMNFFLYIHTL